MKRRSFVKASLLTGTLTSILPQLSFGASEKAQQQKTASQEFYELRVYTFKNDAQQKIVESYFRDAAIPALNRLGSKNIGVFTEQEPKEQAKLYAVIPFSSIDIFMKVTDNLAKDAAYLKAGAAYLNAPATEPAYDRIESSFMRAFTAIPKIVLPEKKPRMFELRRYESHSEMAGKKKIEMFNTAGEIAIFKKVGLTPVFFGETIIGEMQPNLTYLLTFDDMAEHDRNWKLFGSNPEWKKISSMPEYADAKIVSRITRTFLNPTEFSQI